MYSQYGDCIATIDSVTLLHPRCVSGQRVRHVVVSNSLAVEPPARQAPSDRGEAPRTLIGNLLILEIERSTSL